MSDSRKYYYLKLKDNFFELDELVVLESMPDGHLYSNILLKLYLRSLKNEGKLMFNERIPYSPEILASVTRHSVGVVKQALELFKQLNLVDIMSNGEIYMLDIQNFIGESSTEADRIRSYRAKIANQKKANALEIEGCTNVQLSNDICTPEIELELDIELEKDIDIDIEIDKNTMLVSGPSEFEKVFNHYLDLNLVKHRNPTKAMKMAVKTTMKDNGYSVDDCMRLLTRHAQVVKATENNDMPVERRSLDAFFGQKVYQAKHLICSEYDDGGSKWERYKTAIEKSRQMEQKVDLNLLAAKHKKLYIPTEGDDPF